MSRRGTWTSLAVAAVLVLALGWSFSGCRGQVGVPGLPSRPNILIFLADDHGQWAAGCYGNSEIMTPNLDRLAAAGVLIERATSPGPVCSPARASLLTGRLPSQHGIHDFLSESPAHDRDWLSGELMLQEILQWAGYRTALIGKWHLSADSRPPQRGFERWVSYDVGRAGWRNQYLHRGSVHLSDQGRPITVEGRQTEHLVRMAIEFIDEGGPDEPFFLVLAPTDTHAPFEGSSERWLERYRDFAFESVPRGETTLLPASSPEAVVPDPIEPMLAEYFAAVSFQDEQLGVLIDALHSRGLLGATLVVYTSDHGHMNGHHGLVGKANATVPQNFFEETVRVPMVLSWPAGLVSDGMRLDLPFDHIDLFETVIDAAGMNLDKATMDLIDSPGQSLLQRLRDPSIAWRDYQFTEHGNARMASDGKYKLVRRYPPADPRFGDEFYDLAADPRETTNRIGAAEYRDRIDRMTREIDGHFARFEEPERSGLRVMELPAFNGREPWRRLAEVVNPPE